MSAKSSPPPIYSNVHKFQGLESGICGGHYSATTRLITPPMNYWEGPPVWPCQICSLGYHQRALWKGKSAQAAHAHSARWLSASAGPRAHRLPKASALTLTAAPGSDAWGSERFLALCLRRRAAPADCCQVGVRIPYFQKTQHPGLV